ncbi:hypothetical protein NFI00_000060 [Salmonella enterica]|nr:hypothetical protein [Salmonella enterica]
MTTTNNANNNNNSNTADRDFMENLPKGYSRIAGFAGVGIAAGLGIYGGKDPASVVLGAGVGSAYAYLVGGMADGIAPFAGTTGRVCLATLTAAGSFALTANMISMCEELVNDNSADNNMF